MVKEKVTQLVEVEWKDAWGDRRWRSKDVIKYLIPPRIRSVGLLVHKDEEKVIIAATSDNSQPPSGAYSSITLIPIGCIVDIRELRYK